MFYNNKKLELLLEIILDEIQSLAYKVDQMAISQAQFDVLLTALVSAVNQFIADAGSKGVDLTAEAAQVTSALSALQAADSTIPATPSV
jgi:hypothetical protein